MFGKVLAAAIALGAAGGASIAVAQNISAPPSPPERRAVAGAPCAETEFRIYFKPGATDLDGPARATIDTALRDVAGCEALEFNLAADTDQIAQAQSRQHVAQRSVAILNALRDRGVEGEVYVAPLSEASIAAQRNAGPDFVAVAMTPVAPPQAIAMNDR
ncbi:MAG: hypothetical protein NW200_13740 [Hyphomonadaceae bacterium]|nr:hypothetical protein [Hyphomonadaceae bacterium]